MNDLISYSSAAVEFNDMRADVCHLHNRFQWTFHVYHDCGVKVTTKKNPSSNKLKLDSV